MAFNGVDTERLIKEAVTEELGLLGLEIVREVVRYLTEQKINVDGDLMKSIAHETREELGRIQLTVGTNQKHGFHVHEGTGPAVGHERYMPPPEPIRRWVRKKLGVRAKELEAVTRAVRWKIYVKGTKPRPFLTVPLRLFKNKIKGRIARRIEARFHAK